ncbi:MAG: hypothetical protein PHX43_07005, partial [Alphaproteobacteria bacterium]|nr:hypothetical protein [Alphaproteobacteria bacterium]
MLLADPAFSSICPHPNQGAPLSGIQGQTSQAVDTIANITSTIKRINEISTAIASAVEEQGAAT